MFRPRLCRAYATRRPERPPARFPDPLRSAVVTPLEGKLSFIHRPPPSAPTPHSTTLAPASPLLRPATTQGALPPLLRPSAYRAMPRLTRDAIEQLRALRHSDPETYGCRKLAAMFGCTPGFVSQVAALPRAMRRAFGKREEERVEGIRRGWGERKATARAVRERRRAFW